MGKYMRKYASGGQSLANAERGVGLSVPVRKLNLVSTTCQSMCHNADTSNEFPGC